MGMDSDTRATLLAEAADLLPDASKLRRQIHAHPELGLHLPKTQEAVLDSLDGLGLAIRTGISSTSIIGVLDGGEPGPTIILRGDMDALPMPEGTDLAFKSKNEGMMHSCGHDLHTSMLAGAARLLTARKSQLKGRVLFMFQPGEEGFAGAQHMLDEGMLDGVGNVTGAFAIHATSYAPTGHIMTKAGSLMASSDEIHIRVSGAGGHASTPHLALDPVPIACEIVQAIQTMVTRRLDVFDPAVVSITQIVAGTATNIIADFADVYGTIRTVSERTRDLVQAKIEQLAAGIAAAHDLTAVATIKRSYPVTVNNASYARRVLDISTDLVGAAAVHNIANPVMGAEDFSYVLNRVPGAMAFLGATPPGVDPRTAAPNHSPRAMFDENAMTTGMALYTAVALNHLS